MAAGEGDGDGEPRLNLYSLPNEILVQILTPLSTRALLPLTAVSHRFLALVLRILHYRLLVAASLSEKDKDYKLMLECFHPSEKLTEPHVFCAYLGTDGLSERHDDEFAGSLYEDVKETEKLGRLSGLYSRFRPIPREEEGDSGYNGRRFFPTGPGTMVGVVGADSTSTRPEGPEEVVSAEKPRFVKRTIHLESAEDFSQLCTVVNLVRVIPNSNLLLSAVTVEDGIIRIWRDWLEEQAQLERVDAAQRRAAETVSREGHTIPSDAGAGSRPLANGRRRRLEEGDSGILWVDGARNVGLKFRVRQKRWRREETMPVLMHRDEEPAVSYEVDIEELRIRTTRLLWTVEESIQEQQNYSRAVVFGAFRPRGVM
ncbi:hypothetical protein M432DRAFT_563858 [Thermoascus aurantiacus ATCC 26904]